MFILGIAFWVFLLLVVFGVAITYAVEREYPFGAFVGLIASGLVLHFTGAVNMLDVLHNWQQLLMFIGAYIVAGLLWSMFKWQLYVSNWADIQADKLENSKYQFINAIQGGVRGGEDIKEIPEEYAELFALWSSGETPYRMHPLMSSLGITLPSVSYPINAKELGILYNMPRILMWCVYWPFSMLWTLINDPIRKMFQFLVVKVLGGVFAKISQRGLNTVEKQRQAMIKKG